MKLMQNYHGGLNTKFVWIIPIVLGVSVSTITQDHKEWGPHAVAKVYSIHITPFFDIGFNWRS